MQNFIKVWVSTPAPERWPVLQVSGLFLSIWCKNSPTLSTICVNWVPGAGLHSPSQNTPLSELSQHYRELFEELSPASTSLRLWILILSKIFFIEHPSPSHHYQITSFCIPHHIQEDSEYFPSSIWCPSTAVINLWWTWVWVTVHPWCIYCPPLTQDVKITYH